MKYFSTETGKVSKEKFESLLRSSVKTFFVIILFVSAAAAQEKQIIIDVHTHIGSFRGYEIGEKYLLEGMTRYGIRFGLVSNLDGANLPKLTQNLDEIKANEATSNFVRKHRNRFRGLLWARPNDGAASNLEKFLQHERELFAGIKFHPEFNQFPANDKRLDEYLRLCEKYKLVAVFHSGSKGSYSDPEKIYETARRHPNVPFVLYHMSFFGPHDHAIRIAAIAQNRRDASIYLETAQARENDVLNAVEKLGSDRVLFGTDATYFGANHYERSQKLLETLRARLNSEDYFRVTAGNAIRLFRLTELSADRPYDDPQSESSKTREQLSRLPHLLYGSALRPLLEFHERCNGSPY